MLRVVVFSFLVLSICACKEKGPFDHLDTKIASFDAYVRAHQSEVVKEWMYYKDAVKGRYVLFQNDQMMYMRHFRGDIDLIHTEQIVIKDNTFQVLGVEGSFYRKSPKANLNVYVGGKKINVLYNPDNF